MGTERKGLHYENSWVINFRTLHEMEQAEIEEMIEDIMNALASRLLYAVEIETK